MNPVMVSYRKVAYWKLGKLNGRTIYQLSINYLYAIVQRNLHVLHMYGITQLWFYIIVTFLSKTTG